MCKNKNSTVVEYALSRSFLQQWFQNIKYSCLIKNFYNKIYNNCSKIKRMKNKTTFAPPGFIAAQTKQF